MLSFFKKSKPVPVDEEVIERIDGTAPGDGRTANPLSVATVLACVRVIADGCATPPLHVYRTDTNGKRSLATDIPEYRLLHRRPNAWQTSQQFRQMMTLHAALTGGALALKVKQRGQVTELIPVMPGNYQIEEIARYDYRYRVWDKWGEIGVFGAEQVFHLPGLQWELTRDLSAVKLARSAIGLAVDAEEAQAKLHRNGGRPSGILSTDKPLSPDAAGRLKSAWSRFNRNGRSENVILDNGLKYQPIAVNGVDAQHLETRRFQVEEICRTFNIFPIMVGHSDKSATFASSEAFFSAHLKHTLRPWLTLWEQRLDEFILDGSGPLSVELDTRYLTAGSMTDRAKWARTMAEMGIYTRNEIRQEEGRDPLPGLDVPLTPLNTSTQSDGEADEPQPDRQT